MKRVTDVHRISKPNIFISILEKMTMDMIKAEPLLKCSVLSRP